MSEPAAIPDDLDECAREPIHIPGSIQPHGYLFVLNEADLTVAAASKNAADAMGIEPLDLVGRPIGELLASTSTQSLDAALETRNGATPLRIRFPHSAQSAEWDCLIHTSDEMVLLELVPRIGADRAEALLGQVRHAIEFIRRSDSPDGACEVLAREIRRLTGFDRVMIYRFDSDWNGEVIAQDKASGAQSYKGHAFPAADIPAQARELYARIPVRLIPDATYAPSPIIPPTLPPSGRPIDLSPTMLRSVSPVHLEYLANMGVGASMSISLLRDGQLWGLVACHHPAPRMLPDAVVRGCELLTQATTWCLDGWERKAAAECVEVTRRLEAEISRAGDGPDYGARLSSIAPTLLDLTGSQGLAICDRQAVWTAGQVPSNEQILALAAWLPTGAGDRLVTSHLSTLWPAAESCRAVASGIAARRLPSGWLIWFRAEWLHTVTWAGEPSADLRARSGQGRINPRKSFAAWRQSVRGQSRRWTASSLLAVDEIQLFVLRTIMADQMRRLVASEHALAAAKTRAEDASRAKSQFLARMSHEVRTPLNGIIGFAELLAGADLPAAEREQAQFIRDAGDTLLVIIDDILDFSKIEAGQVSLERIAFSLPQVLHSCIALHELPARNKGLTLELHTAPGLPEQVLGDPTRLRQVLTNLLSNAVKFSARGGITVRVAQGGPQEDREVIRFEVADTGIGIAREKQAGMFEQFTQAETSTTRQYGGTGLGLAICRSLVGLMGGEIGVESSLGHGSVFWFTAILPAAERPQPGVAVPRDATIEAPSRRLRVLVADDTRINQALARILLESAGHDVVIVADGAAAIAAAERERFDLILMDMHMPTLDGLDATRAIRALPGAAGQVPIVALTASAFAEDIERCRSVGMNGHLAKPILKAALLELLRSLGKVV